MPGLIPILHGSGDLARGRARAGREAGSGVNSSSLDLAMLPAAPQQRRIALTAIGVLALIAAIGAPFARITVGAMPNFVMLYGGAVLMSLAISSTILFGQFALSRRPSLLVLACGALFSGLFFPYFALRILRGRRQKKFGAQFPDAIDIIVRSLRAGHPVPIAVNMVAREMTDPIGSEFGLVADEITYGADLETAMRNLYSRVGQDDLPLFVTAVAIQGSTGGNLGEILENLSSVIRQRFKMRRKVKALAAEGRMSAIMLSSLPIGVFFMIHLVSPDFYGSVWQFDLTKMILAAAGAWMLIGNFAMYRLVNFRI